MNDAMATVFDLLKVTAWSAGVMVRQFDLGRRGCLPELVSDEGRKALVAEEEHYEQKHTSKTSFPMGFA